MQSHECPPRSFPGTVHLPGVVIEPAEVRSMAAALTAIGASVRTRLGAGPRVKAHVDHGAWTRPVASGATTTARDDVSVSSFVQPPIGLTGRASYGAGEDGSMTSGELLPDLGSLLEALGGPRPHPAVGIAGECVEAQVASCGGGGTWALVLASLLVRAGEDLAEGIGADRREIARVFQEASKVAQGTARRLMTPLAAASEAAVSEAAAREALTEARALTRRDGIGSSGSLRGGVGQRRRDGNDDATKTLAGSDARALAALALGFDRDRHPGDATLILAAALTLARRRRRADVDGGGSDLEVDATRASVQIVPGLPSDASAVVPGLLLRLEPGNCPGGGGVYELCETVRRYGRATAKGTAAAAPRATWRALLIHGDVAPIIDRSAAVTVDYAGADDRDAAFASASEEREDYASEVSDAVTEAGGVDVVIASGFVDAVAAVSLRRRAGVSAVIANVGHRDIANFSSLAGVRPVLDIRRTIASDIAGSSPRGGDRTAAESVVSDDGAMRAFLGPGDSSPRGFALRLAVTVSAGWDPDESLLPQHVLRLRRGGRDPPSQSFLSVTRAERDERIGFSDLGADRHDDDNDDDDDDDDDDDTACSFRETPACSVTTVAICAPVLEQAEAREVELVRGLRRISNALNEDGTGLGSHAIIRGGVRHSVPLVPWETDGEEKKNGTDNPTTRGYVMLGLGAFELAAAAAVTCEARRCRTSHAATSTATSSRCEAERAALEASMRAAGVDPEVLAQLRTPTPKTEGSRGAALEGATRREAILEAFAACLRDLHRIATQNFGARYDDSVASAQRGERVLSRRLADGARDGGGLWDGASLGTDVWPEYVAALEGAEVGSGEGLKDGWSPGSRRAIYPLEDGRSRVQGLMTAMSITRLVLLTGAVVTKMPRNRHG